VEDDDLSASDPQRLQRIAASYDAPPLPRNASALWRTTWLLQCMTRALERDAQRYGWPILRHEDVTQRLPESMQKLAGDLRLTWTEGSRVFAATCGRLEIQHLFTRPYRPRTNGKVCEDLARCCIGSGLTLAKV
jgi:hypothetical protein